MSLPHISAEEKMIARFLEERFGKRPKFFVHRDNASDPDYIGIGRATDFPDGGLTTMATNGISNRPLFTADGKEYPDTRLELVGTCLADQADAFQEMIFFAGSIVIKQKWFCAPGTFLQDAVSRFGSFGDMKHLYFTTPFAVEGFTTKIFGSRKVSWLSALPVSTAEVEYARRHTTDMLEQAFEDKDVDWANLARPSIF